MNTLYSRSVLLLSLLLIITVSYYPALVGPFLLDDHQNIPQTHIDELTLSSLKEVALSNNSGSFGRPVPVATFALNHYFGDGTPFSFKLTNLIIHLVNVLLAFWLLRHIVNLLPSNGNAKTNSGSFLFAFSVTAIWALHPLQVSTVMYPVQRMTLLMTTFSLLALVSYCHARINSSYSLKKFILYLLATASFTALACLSKENGVLVILYIGFIELLSKLGSGHNTLPANQRRLTHSVLSIVAIALVSGFIYLYLNIEQFTESYNFREFTFLERIATEGNVLVLYLKNILMPDISNMNLYLDSFPIAQIYESETIMSYTALLFMGIAAVFLFKKHPIVTFGIGFFFISHLLESTIIPLEIAFEHRNYIGLLGIALTVVYLTACITAKINIGLLKTAIPILALMILCTQTYSRSIEWSDDIVLHSLALKNNPNSYRARLALATAYIEKSDLTAAVNVFETATRINEHDTKSLLRLIQFKAYGAVFNIDEFQIAKSLLASQPVTTEISMILSNMLHQVNVGVYAQPRLDQISELFKIASDNKKYRFRPTHKAALHARYSSVLSSQEKYEEALIELQEAFQYNSRNPEIIILTAELLQILDRQNEISNAINLLPEGINLTVYQKSRVSKLTEIANKSPTSNISLTQNPD